MQLCAHFCLIYQMLVFKDWKIHKTLFLGVKNIWFVSKFLIQLREHLDKCIFNP